MSRKWWYGSKWCWPATRWAIYFRDHLQCVWCGKPYGAETLDHLIPGDRGSKRPHHLVASCLECNSKRKSRSVRSWLAGREDKAEVLERLGRRFDRLDRKNALARKSLLLSGTEVEWNFAAMADKDDVPF